MRKMLTVASSEFQTAVRSKAFIVGVALMPILILASIGIQKVTGDRIDREERSLAVIDETGRLYPMLAQAADAWNATQVAADGTITGPRYRLTEARLDGGTVDQLRLALSDRVRRKELFAFAELPAALLKDQPTIRYHSNSTAMEALPNWLEQAVARLVIVERLQIVRRRSRDAHGAPGGRSISSRWGCSSATAAAASSRRRTSTWSGRS